MPLSKRGTRHPGIQASRHPRKDPDPSHSQLLTFLAPFYHLLGDQPRIPLYLG
ncbi:hypothetical protein I79_013024 [Cricetulus griseus]|uniref:Uncharacterized protein n=1 Tax=Cricetulus griseus TaxID=10029 RepID=G3HQC7_CRIGR|nr:hypothetical protein I79_013024 [Cricetulus griseus]